MRSKNLLKGHTLVNEGRVVAFSDRRPRGGRAECSCGAQSVALVSTRDRQRWHREHKEEIRKAARMAV